MQTKCMGLRYPTHFLKSRDNVIRNNILEYRTKQVNIFAQQMLFIHYSPQIKKHILYSHISCSCSDTIYTKGILRDFRNAPFYIHCLFHIINLRMFSLLFFILLQNGP